MRSKISAVLVASVLSLVAAVAATNSASAASSTAVRFMAQARSAGLTSAQAAALQAKVDRDLSATSGKQVAPNRIQFDGGMLYIALPGEVHPRNLQPGVVAPHDPCAGGGADYGHMCAYSKTNFTGSEIDMYACKRYYVSTWSGNGSWDNNQTAKTDAYFYGPTGDYLDDTGPAPSRDASGDWSVVHSVINC